MSEAEDRTEDREFLLGLLPKSQHKKIDDILKYFGHEVMRAVEIRGAKAGVERVEAYGLCISLDAHGNAAEVEFPYGADVLIEG